MNQEENDTYLDISGQYPPYQSAIKYDDSLRMHSINSEVANFQTPNNVYFYWRLPNQFLGNQLMSYGGYLRYSIRYRQSYASSPLQIPDVIIRGNGITLYHYEKSLFDDPTNIKISIRFWTGFWHKDNQHANSQVPPLFEDTTREDIMIVLQNVQEILIKASYDPYLLDSSISDIRLESSFISNVSDPDRSAFIEQCSCPLGYMGPSCEQCTSGYVRYPAGRYLGKCELAPTVCQCNGHSDKCDPFTGECIGCLHHTEGFNCERCERGFYHNPELSKTGEMQCTLCPCGQNNINQIKQ